MIICIGICKGTCMYVNQIDQRREFFEHETGVLGCVEDMYRCTYIYVCVYVHIYICMYILYVYIDM